MSTGATSETHESILSSTVASTHACLSSVCTADTDRDGDAAVSLGDAVLGGIGGPDRRRRVERRGNGDPKEN